MKLVTVIAAYDLEHRLMDDLRALGVTGYTTAKVNGSGRQGPRRLSIVDPANVRIETLVQPVVAARILERIAIAYEGDSLVAYALDVEAVRRAPHV